jgi:integrase
LSSALSWAVKRKRLQANPCKAVERPHKPEKRAPKVLDAPDRRRLLETVKSHRLEPAVVLGLVGGLRIAEACAVRWEDLTDTGDLTISRSWWGRTKSGRERTLRLPATAAAALRAWKRRQREELLAVGIRQTEEIPIVSNLVGQAMMPKHLTERFTGFAREHGFDATFHTLRHSCATWLLHAGVDVVTVARRLGHADPGLVLRVYGHATKDSDRDAAERMQAALGEGRM